MYFMTYKCELFYNFVFLVTTVILAKKRHFFATCDTALKRSKRRFKPWLEAI